MVNVDSLRFRKNKVRQPMQYAWCAATTKHFVGVNANKISRKEIVELDIGALCDDIMSDMSDSQERMRCTLYLASMLTFGTVRLFEEQTNFIMEDCEKLTLDLLGGQNLTQKKKKKTKAPPIPEAPPAINISLTPLPTPTFDPVKTFGKKNIEDRHLLTEIDFIQIPQTDESFGFNPNERELTDRDMANFYREIMGEDPQPIITDETPQDNEQPFRVPFEMNDEPMPQAGDPIENQLPPNHDPQVEIGMMKTPKRPTRSAKPKQKPDVTPESAKTAYSPPKKRSRVSAQMPYDDDNDDMMIASEPTREASLPGEAPRDVGYVASPIFEFRKRRQRNVSLKNLERIMNKSKNVAAMLDEPVLNAPEDAPVQDEPPTHVDPVDNAQVNLPDVSIHEPLPATEPPEDNAPTHSPNVPTHHAVPTAAAQPNANDSAHMPTPSPKISASDLTLGSLRSFEENYRKKYIKRGNKIFADRTRQIEIEARPPNFMILTREERLFTSVLRKESIDSLFNLPATLRRERFLPEYRHWPCKLLKNYLEIKLALTLAIPQKAPTRKRKKRGEENRENSQQNEEPPIENMEIVQEQPQPPLPEDIGTNDQPAVEIPEEHRADLMPEDNPTNMETFEPPVNAASVDMQTENPENQIINDVNHEAVNTFEQPPIQGPVTEEPPLPEINDQVVTEMSPTKRFKSRDNQEIQNMDTRSKKNLTTDELFEIIQSFWDKLTRRDIEQLGFISVEFEKIIRPGYYNVVEAGRYLYYCFLLENKEKLYLQQHEPYDTIHLIKW